MMRVASLISILMLLSLGLPAVAQNDCPALVRAALEVADAACAATGRNQLCYGHGALTAVPQADGSDFNFAQPGDVVSTSAVQTLQLSPLNLTDETWGLTLMNVQANLPADRQVTLVLFGDAEVENVGTAVQVEAAIAAPNPINVRSAPSTQGEIVRILDPGTAVTVNGRNAAGDWLHIQLDDGDDGWLAAYLLQTEADVLTLAVVDAEMANYAPMQAVVMRTGVHDAACPDAPNSGLLVQTPDSVDSVELQINGVELRLSGTAFLQADAGNALFVNLLEGTGTVRALQTSTTIPAGAMTVVPVADDLLVSAAPANPTPYTLEELQALPLALLPRPIDIIDPLVPRQINQIVACRITATVPVANFREGPDTAYFANGILADDTPYRVDGRTLGSDGFVWWRVAARRWVRADIVAASGNCDTVVSVDARPRQPSTQGYSSDLTCTSERVIYAHVGDTIPIADSYQSSAIPVGAIVATLFVDGDVIYEGVGMASGSGIVWTTSWVATPGIHNVEMLYTPTIQINPDWAQEPFEAGDSWSHAVCQIRVE
ncbi:MAG: SH3 domain-containing protein [Anaerolineae bacterium]|nr:SH3 domain-containing protein [Anaerolineae bacterium]